MPGNEQNVTLLSHTAVNENGAATSPIPTPGTSTPKQNGKNPLPPEKVEKIISNIPASNSALLIFDFNQTIVESPICNQFASKNYSRPDEKQEKRG
ncbi:hypothetical protein IYZ83_002995 [Wolbachia pipientis]|uniref:hypothetical protein n=1 Tax=Wolbachia pipientis TaxID=955 RepID=UPI001BD95EA1|nr:hypothetical protein [Wolbachia pipientis]UIP91141.1 hypothetical protein IYZ83_002995 [Wolbachia pipientis]